MIKELYLFSGFYLYNKYLENYYNKKNARNMLAFTHAFGSVLINSLYLLTGNSLLLNTSFNYSIGYFIYDMYYIIFFEKLNFLRCCYIYHHLGALYIIYNSSLLTTVPLLLFAGELSNLPSYYIYHNLHLDNKTEETDKKISKCKQIQKYLYGSIRVPVMTYLMYDVINNFDYSNPTFYGIFTAGFPIYLMGLAWTYKLIFNKN